MASIMAYSAACEPAAQTITHRITGSLGPTIASTMVRAPNRKEGGEDLCWLLVRSEIPCPSL